MCDPPDGWFFQIEGLARERALRQRTAHEPVLYEHEKADRSEGYSGAAAVEKLLCWGSVSVFRESTMRNQGRLPGGADV